MRPILYISTFLLTLGLLASCSNSVDMGDSKPNVTKTTPTPLEPKPNDADGDGVLDESDNCPTLANADQGDSNSNGVGDVCEDLECASNFCEDNQFLSGQHCDGGFSVACSTQSDGCLTEGSRMNCSEGCQSEGDLMGECKPKPRDLTDPLIDSASGAIRHGSTVTITGEDFGSHGLNIEWTGKDIENTPAGADTLVALGENWSKRNNSGINDEVTTVEKWSGSKSLDMTVDQVVDCDGGACAARTGYSMGSGFDAIDNNKVFVSYWFKYHDIVGGANGEPGGAKHARMTCVDCGSGGYPYSSTPNTINITIETDTKHEFGNMSMKGCADPYSIKEAPLVNAVGVGYEEQAEDGNWSFLNLLNCNRGADSHNKAFSIEEDAWQRMDYYFHIVPDAYDGEAYIAVFKPVGGGSAYSPGMYIGRWAENLWLRSEETAQCLNDNGTYRAADQALWGFYFFTDNAANNAHTQFWVDDVYIQEGTRSRVEIGNAPNLEECTHREIQHPTSWSDGEIQFELNYGGGFKPGDTAYIFVINENEYDQGDRDAYGNGHYDFAGVSPGYPITLE